MLVEFQHGQSLSQHICWLKLDGEKSNCDISRANRSLINSYTYVLTSGMDTWFLASFIALSLSQCMIVDSGEELWSWSAVVTLRSLHESGVGDIRVGLISWSSCLNHIASCAPKDKALYSLSVKESETKFCFFEHQETAPPANVKVYAPVDLKVSRHEPHVASV